MTEKLAQAGEGGWCTPTTFHYIYHHVQRSGVRYIAERAETLPLFLPYSYVYIVKYSKV